MALSGLPSIWGAGILVLGVLAALLRLFGGAGGSGASDQEPRPRPGTIEELNRAPDAHLG